MFAIPLDEEMPTEKSKPPKNPAGRGHFELLRRWSDELGQDWDDVLKKAGIRDKARSTKSRMVLGTASLSTATKIGETLQGIEAQLGQRASVGPHALLLREWAELGAKLALHSPEDFDDILERVRKIAIGAEARKTGPFTRAAK